MKQDLTEKVRLPERVSAKLEINSVEVTGEKGTVKKIFSSQSIKFDTKDNQIILFCKGATKREKKNIKTYVAHLKNMIEGVQSPHIYKLKVCSGHFPMNVTFKNDELSVKNFLGEKTPRTFKVPSTVSLKLDGEIITIESADIEAAGQCAASIEQLMRITNRDRRRFQDGIYITHKPGKEIK